tara:strand:+ start:1221 stop:1433 length:213 start_codon:yes stop_codon:yes gene_type:complete
MKTLTEQQIQWIKENEVVFKVSLRLTQDRLQMVFDLHNHITGLNKKTTGCGRCVDNTKKIVYDQFKKQTL